MSGIDFGLVAVGLYAVAVLVAALSLYAILLERHQVYRTLRAMRTFEIESTDYREHELAPTFAERVIKPGLGRVIRLGRPAVPGSSSSRIQRELVQAGSPPGWDVERVLTFKIVGVAVFGIITPLLTSATDAPTSRVLLLTAVLAAAGYLAPDWILRGKARTRQTAIRKSLPDTLDLLAISVEAGLAFDGALSQMARQSSGPLAEELNRVLREMQLGKPRVEALRDLADRSSLPELNSFVLAMVQADVFGVSIGDVLKVQAREMRVKRRQRAEEQAQKIPVKIVFPLVLCILPTLFVMLLGPAAINVYTTILGN